MRHASFKRIIGHVIRMVICIAFWTLVLSVAMSLGDCVLMRIKDRGVKTFDMNTPFREMVSYNQLEAFRTSLLFCPLMAYYVIPKIRKAHRRNA
ncbi:hypothetical protein BSF38_00140 [Paludisphaera borealis]|uniref:Uncharacterized protein n=1 Tax=Paludisphaera borealis TaxID=1387353 RepID=A0A1U7CIK5_9BACT|nr:hypothetical protein BSF38_00140 [Paludisphaera borealis]